MKKKDHSQKEALFNLRGSENINQIISHKFKRQWDSVHQSITKRGHEHSANSSKRNYKKALSAELRGRAINTESQTNTFTDCRSRKYTFCFIQNHFYNIYGVINQSQIHFIHRFNSFAFNHRNFKSLQFSSFF